MTAQLIDIGVNLGHRQFAPDRADVISRAVAAGVGTMVVTGTSGRESQEAQRLAASHPGVLYSTAGVHPHNARDWNAQTKGIIRQLAGRPEVVAIGECGLDFNRDFSPRPDQERCFEEQIELAIELKKPLFLHDREAHNRFVAILGRQRDQISAAVVHCFTGTAQELDSYLEMDLYIGITGWICDERRGQHLRELVRHIPLERLMLETDAPFLIPRNMPNRQNDRRNEPSYLPYVLQTVAQSLRLPADQVAGATTETARKFFGIS